MRLGVRARFTLFLTIAAMVTAGASPACRFLSGQSNPELLVICSGAGLKSITLADAASTHHDKQDHAAKPCPFCLAIAKVKAFGAAASPQMSRPSAAVTFTADIEARPITGLNAASFQARGPPPCRHLSAFS